MHGHHDAFFGCRGDGRGRRRLQILRFHKSGSHGDGENTHYHRD
jgi:hypothetical protein